MIMSKTYIIDALRAHLKARNLTYKELAAGIALSEVSIKRLFASGDCTLDRLEQICNFLQIELADLFKSSPKKRKLISQLTQAQETTTDAGTATNYWRVAQKGTDTTGSSASAYAPAPIQETSTLSATRYEQNTANASTSIAPTASTMSTVLAKAIQGPLVEPEPSLFNLSTVAASSTAPATPNNAPQTTTAQSGSAQTQVKTTQPNTQITQTEQGVAIKSISHSRGTMTDVSSVSTNMLSGKYELSKAVAGNLLNNGSASQSDASTTRTAISAAQVTVGTTTTDTNKDALTDSNGKAVSSDTSATNRTLARADVAALQQQAQQKQANNMLLLKAATAFTDPAFKAAFLDQAKMYKKVVVTDEDGKTTTQWQELTPEEKAAIPPGSRIANNGIFNGGPNDPQAAQDLAKQNSSDEADYLVHFPQANNRISELLVAGYQKFLEGSTLGLTNATQQNVDLWNQTGGNITLDGHSRGGMTVGNALEVINDQGGRGGSTNVNLFGSAYNAQDAANTVNQITDGKGRVQQSTNNYDFIGRVLGNNPGTGGTIPEGSSVLEEVIRTMGGTATVHNCYGAGNDNCSAPSRFGHDYVAPPLVPVPPSGTGDKKP